MSRFKKTRIVDEYYFILSAKNDTLYIPCTQVEKSEVYDYYKINSDEINEYWHVKDLILSEEQEITDYCDNILFELLKAYGIEYDEDKNFIKRVVYTWDLNLIPGEKFIGLKLMGGLDGTEKDINDLIPKITMGLDILDCFRFDFSGYRGLKGTYRLYLSYTEDNIEIYKNYLRFHIDRRFPTILERKIKI